MKSIMAFINSFFLAGIFVSILSCSNSKRAIQNDYIGQWESEKVKITVRTKEKNEPYKFISDYAVVSFKITEGKTASGQIGQTRFENVSIKKNPELLWETGVEYIIECGSVGKIFNADPLSSKEVEIWICPLEQKGKLKAELRYTEGMAVFPMADVDLTKKEE